jgi:hypothetical protein
MKDKYPRRYIDEHDVERGYYVYAHLCKQTRRVFYVGKGHTGRAWSRHRPDRWHEYVETLPEGYEVQLLHEDLTEVESFELEKEEIAKNGGAAAIGGTLLNWLPESTMDGDIGPAAVVGLQWELSDQRKEQIAAYNAVRQFQQLSPRERKEAAERLKESATASYSQIAHIYSDYFDRNEESPSYLQWARDINSEIFTLAHRLASKKMRYEAFCEATEDQVEQLESNFNDIGETSAYRGLLADNLESVKKWFSQFEIPGNKESAQKAEQDLIDQQFFAEHGVERTSEEGRSIIKTQLLALLEQVKGLSDLNASQAEDTEFDLPQ